MLPYRYPEDWPEAKRRGRLIWPAKMDKINEFRKMLSPMQFSIAMEMDPTGGNKSMLSYEQIKALATESEVVDVTDGVDAVLVSLDPASGSKARRADYAGITAFRITWPKDDDKPNIQLFQAIKYAEELYDQVITCAQLARNLDAPVVIEGNSQQWGSYSSVFRNIANDVRIIRHQTTDQNKTDTNLGITVIRTMLREGRLHIPPDMTEDESTQTLMREIRDLGMQGAHDHLCASLWFGVWWAYKQRRALRGPQIVNGFVPTSTSQYRGFRPRFTASRF
jgi:hypothetical protein